MSVRLHTASGEIPCTVRLLPLREVDGLSTWCDFCGAQIATKVALVFATPDPAGISRDMEEIACLFHLTDIDPEITRAESIN